MTSRCTGTAYAAVTSPSRHPTVEGAASRITNVPVGTYEVAASKAQVLPRGGGLGQRHRRPPRRGGHPDADPAPGRLRHRRRGPHQHGRATPAARPSTLALTQLLGAARVPRQRGRQPSRAWPSCRSPAPQPAVHALARRRAPTPSTRSTRTPRDHEPDLLGSSIVLDSAAPPSPALSVNGGAPSPAPPTRCSGHPRGPGALPARAWTRCLAVAQVRLSNETGATDAGGDAARRRASASMRDLTFARRAPPTGRQTVYAQFEDHAGNASAVVSSTGRHRHGAARPGSISVANGATPPWTGYTNTPLVTWSSRPPRSPTAGFVLIKLANSQAALNTAVFQPVRATSAWFLDPSSADGVKTVYAHAAGRGRQPSGAADAQPSPTTHSAHPGGRGSLRAPTTNDAGHRPVSRPTT